MQQNKAFQYPNGSAPGNSHLFSGATPVCQPAGEVEGVATDRIR